MRAGAISGQIDELVEFETISLCMTMQWSVYCLHFSVSSAWQHMGFNAIKIMFLMWVWLMSLKLWDPVCLGQFDKTVLNMQCHCLFSEKCFCLTACMRSSVFRYNKCAEMSLKHQRKRFLLVKIHFDKTWNYWYRYYMLIENPFYNSIVMPSHR